MCCSCMACNSADWVRGLARLISSAIRSWANTGPEMKRNDRFPVLLWSTTPAPRMPDGVKPERDPEGFDQLGLGKAGNSDQKRMTAGQDRHQGIFNHPVLTENNGGNRVLGGADLTGDL